MKTMMRSKKAHSFTWTDQGYKNFPNHVYEYRYTFYDRCPVCNGELSIGKGWGYTRCFKRPLCDKEEDWIEISKTQI